jgi:RNA polymerase sigma factor (sigma-70 family)
MEDFEGWYRMHYNELVAALASMSGDAYLGRDAADEAFTRALDKWPRVRLMTSPTGWVFRVGVNVVRRAKRRRALEERLLRRQPPVGASIPHPEVWEAVRHLPKRQQQVVVLRYAADLPEHDIGMALGISRGTVSSHLADARRRLAVLLADDEILLEVSP